MTDCVDSSVACFLLAYCRILIHLSFNTRAGKDHIEIIPILVINISSMFLNARAGSSFFIFLVILPKHFHIGWKPQTLLSINHNQLLLRNQVLAILCIKHDLFYTSCLSFLECWVSLVNGEKRCLCSNMHSFNFQNSRRNWKRQNLTKISKLAKGKIIIFRELYQKTIKLPHCRAVTSL